MNEKIKAWEDIATNLRQSHEKVHQALLNLMDEYLDTQNVELLDNIILTAKTVKDNTLLLDTINNLLDIIDEIKGDK